MNLKRKDWILRNSHFLGYIYKVLLFSLVFVWGAGHRTWCSCEHHSQTMLCLSKIGKSITGRFVLLCSIVFNHVNYYKVH